MFEHVLLSHPVVEGFSVQVVAFSTPLTSGEFEVDYIEGNVLYENNRSLKRKINRIQKRYLCRQSENIKKRKFRCMWIPGSRNSICLKRRFFILRNFKEKLLSRRRFAFY